MLMVTSKRPTDSKKKQTMHCLGHTSGMIQYKYGVKLPMTKQRESSYIKKSSWMPSRAQRPRELQKPYKSLHSRCNHTRRLHIPNTDLHQHNSLVQLCHPIATPQLSMYQKQPFYKGAIYINILPYLRREPIKTLNKEFTKWLQGRSFYTASATNSFDKLDFH